MNFRVLATVPRRSERGNKYDHTIYVGEFDPSAHDEHQAREHARKKVREIFPAVEFALKVEEIPSLVFHH